MTLAAVHQAVPSLSTGDAMGRLALTIKAELRGMGLQSEIFAESASETLRSQAHTLRELPSRAAGQAVLLHYGISSPATDAVLSSDARRALIYYNITPEHVFDGVSRLNRDRVRSARLELPWLVSGFDVALAHSEFSRRDLVAAGFTSTALLPAIVPPPAHRRARRPEPATVLGVGRLSPHKRWELALRAMAAVRREVRDARLILIGSALEMEPYGEALARMAARLDCGAVLLGRVDDETLEDAYARAAVLVLPSAHEGFGVPLLEAMVRGVPVVATPGGAVPETVAGAGIVCDDDPLVLAEAVITVLGDARVRDAMVARGLHRAAELSPALLRGRLGAVIASWGAA